MTGFIPPTWAGMLILVPTRTTGFFLTSIG
jgi:hypothetical protein